MEWEGNGMVKAATPGTRMHWYPETPPFSLFGSGETQWGSGGFFQARE